MVVAEEQLTQAEKQLIDQIEKQMKCSIEDAFDHKFFDDILSSMVFQKLINQNG